MQIDLVGPFTATGTGKVVEINDALKQFSGPVVIQCGPGARLALEKAVLTLAGNTPKIKATGTLLTGYMHGGSVMEVSDDETVPADTVRIKPAYIVLAMVGDTMQVLPEFANCGIEKKIRPYTTGDKRTVTATEIFDRGYCPLVDKDWNIKSVQRIVDGEPIEHMTVEEMLNAVM